MYILVLFYLKIIANQSYFVDAFFNHCAVIIILFIIKDQ